jgi:hypothetical protein
VTLVSSPNNCPPFKIPLDPFVPRRTERNPPPQPPPPPRASGGLVKTAVRVVAGLGVGGMVFAFCKGAIEEGGGHFVKHYWPQVFGAEDSAPPRRRSR